MRQHVLVLTASALILAGTTAATAQQSGGSPMAQQPVQGPMQQQGSGHESIAGQRGMMSRGMMGQRGMGRGMPGPRGMMGSPLMMRIVFILMDSNGDGTISLQEFQSAHERIFKAMDANHDGRLTLEEMQAFMQGSSKSMPRQ
ncbi:MAG TPA: EF-hand domain-containing protein [Pseudolabrys sp.]|nr:EF-hand domain-containing protein [Pseudolabrys sp.]